jgi:cellulose synthase/poly-beta-1,6-N-acetylglucosamine synthase-like glycosyltransferase
VIHAAVALDGVFAVLGAASLAVVVAGVAYAVDQLLRRRRYVVLAAFGLAVAAALTGPGAWVLGAACALVVSTQAACYLYFTARTVLRRRRAAPVWRDPLPAVAVVVPARDEAAVLEPTLASLDALDYPRTLLEIVVVDDGSVDATLALATEAAATMRHRVRVVHHDRGAGKARRLNEVVQSLGADFVLVLDADHWVSPDLLRRMLSGFVGQTDVACVQVASAVRNGDDGVLTKMLELEYLCRCRAFYPGKAMGVFVGSGGLFRRSALLAVGGFNPAMLTEDVDLSYRLYAGGMRIVYDDAVQSRDLAPSTLSGFFRQRYRWMRGVWQAMLLHLGAKTSASLARVRMYFVQFTLDGLGALCLCLLEIELAFGRSPGLGRIAQASMFLMLASCAVACTVAVIRGGRARDLAYLPLVPLYLIAHSIPMTWALIDNYLLSKPIVWTKTERGRQSEANIDFSRGRA